MSVTIPLTRGLVAVVDEEDYERVAAFKWHARPKYKTDGFYAVNGRGGAKPTSYGVQYLHRFVLSAPSDMFVDHINGDGLDNRRENLRLATLSQNNINIHRPNPTGFRGVEKTQSGRWRARLVINRQLHCSCPFDMPEEAAKAYDQMARQHHGAFAVLNFPQVAA